MNPDDLHAGGLRTGIQASQARLAALAREGSSDEHGRLQAAVAELSTTLEELRVADEELRAQNTQLEIARREADGQAQRYRELFELVPAGYVITDTSGAIQEWNQNAARLFGVPPTSLHRKPLTMFIHEAHLCRVREHLAGCVDLGQPVEFDCWGRAAGDRRPTFNVKAIPTMGPAGRAVGVRWLFQDLTDQRAAETRARELDDALWVRVADRTAWLTSERDLLRTEVDRLRKAIEGGNPEHKRA